MAATAVKLGGVPPVAPQGASQGASGQGADQSQASSAGGVSVSGVPSSPSGAAEQAMSARAICCPGHGRPIHSVAWAKRGEDDLFLLSSSLDKKPQLRWGDNGDWIGTYVGHKGAVWCACVDKNMKLVATAGADFCAKLWNAESGELLHTFDHKHIVKSVDFSPNGKKLLTGGLEKVLRVYHVERPDEAPATISQAEKIVSAIWINDDIILSALADGTIKVIDVSSAGAEIASIGSPGKLPVKDIEISADRKTLTVAIGKSVIFYDLATFALIKHHDFKFDVGAASLHPHGKAFVCGGSDLWLHVHDFETGEETRCFKGHHGPIFCLRYSPDGNTIASGSEDSTVRMWRAPSCEKAEAK